ncbi:MAG: ribonuclease J [Oscillospiraceae bacterium]|nr:ribonuclease J [Oscillospiraceae bacterium]
MICVSKENKRHRPGRTGPGKAYRGCRERKEKQSPYQKTKLRGAGKGRRSRRSQGFQKRGYRAPKKKREEKIVPCDTPLRIIPLGGLGEIGKNMTLYESGSDTIIVDCGLACPDEDLLGVDLVIPDFTYVERTVESVRGIFITHGHEDHIGALPYLLRTVNIPVYASKLTIGLIEGKLKEHGLLGKVQLNVVAPGDRIKAGCMEVEFIHVNHSIPDACALAIHTPAGVVIQTGDFKIDYTPIQGDVIDLARFGELGSKGVLALLADSTNVERPGSTPSEHTVGDSFDKLFRKAGNRRIIVATFSSNIHRVQQIIDCSARYGRKVCVSGRSMVNVVNTAVELGYLNIPENMLVDLDLVGRYPDDQMVVITTGSQGEAMSALTRMARGDHRKLQITPNDMIIISATPIPGNEKTVGRVVNDLMKLGAEVIYERMYDVHVSGHACQDELRMMLGLTRPRFFMPVHGEYKHLKKHSDLAISMGMDPRRIFISEIGKVLETDGVKMNFMGTVPAGRVLVDGLGVGDVGSIVLRDRKHLSEDGLIVAVATIDSASGTIVAGPDLVSRGFVYVREAEDMIREAEELTRSVIEDCLTAGSWDWATIKQRVRDELSGFLFSRTRRSPMILPIIQEI